MIVPAILISLGRHQLPALRKVEISLYINLDSIQTTVDYMVFKLADFKHRIACYNTRNGVQAQLTRPMEGAQTARYVEDSHKKDIDTAI